MKYLILIAILFSINASADYDVNYLSSASIRQVQVDKCNYWNRIKGKNGFGAYGCGMMPRQVSLADYHSTYNVISELEQRIQKLEARLLKLESN